MASESSVGGVGGSAMLGSTSRMHFVPERLQIQETAPQTDEEWDIALELYGKDRDDPLYRSAPPSATHSRVTSGAEPPSDRGDRFRDDRTRHPRLPSKRSRSYRRGRDHSSDGYDSPSTPSTPTEPIEDPNLQRRRPLIPRRGMAASDEDDDADIDPSNSIRARKRKAFGVGGMISAPPVMCAADMSGRKKDEWDAAQERKRLREYYEREGWLQGSKPAWRTKVRRRKVLRRLGLTGSSEDDVERRTIITNYMEMAQQMFNVDNVGFGLLRDDGGYRYSIDPDTPPILCPHEGFATSYVALTTHEVCTILPDTSRDWRTRGHPMLKQKGAMFMAGAPLLYTRHDPPVVFGALIIFDSKPREVFTHREQGMLMRLANMLVYQLATFQSEVLAESTSIMYESSLAFLRRSVVPRHAWENQEHEPTPRKSDKPGIASRRQQRKAKRNGAADSKGDRLKVDRAGDARRGDSGSISPGPGHDLSRATSEVAENETDMPLIPYTVKAGPREQQESKKRWELGNSDLFADAASTLRGILGADAVAIYNMEDYSLFYRRTDAPDLELDKNVVDPANASPLFDFMHGRPWPENLQPIVHHIPSSMGPRDPLLGVSLAQGTGDGATSAVEKDGTTSSEQLVNKAFDFAAPDMSQTLAEALVAYLTKRRFWWQRHGSSPLEQKVLAIVPGETQTLLVHFMFTFDGRLRTATFACWNRAPAQFEESNTLSLPFMQILGGLSGAALSFRKVRSMEQSQISYSNLQAHELRTPLHQILAITQLLRSAMIDLAEAPQSSGTYVNSVQQIRDLIPILDAIDTSGKTLHGIVDNILSFLDLKARDYSSPDAMLSPQRSMFDSPSSGTRTLVEMLEETVQEAHEENERSRRSALMPLNSIETIIEIEPKELGEQYKEDSGGALRRALGKILSNAYKFIEGPGCVEVRVTDPVGAPQGCEGMCRTRRIQIEVSDNGPGMDSKFVRDHLGEPWAKQDAFTTGSGLSVHLAYRIVDLMGGHMEIHSAPGRGCIVRFEVPLTPIQAPGSRAPGKADEKVLVDSPEAMTEPVNAVFNLDQSLGKGRKTALVGFRIPDRTQSGLPKLGELLSRQLTSHGAIIVPVPEADLIVANGEVEEVEQGKLMMQHATASEVVFLTMPGHEPHLEVIHAAKQHAKRVRRIAKPVTPSVIRHILAPPPVPTKSPGHVDFRTSPGTLSDLGRRISIASSSDRLLQTPPLVASTLGKLPPSGSILLQRDGSSGPRSSGLATPPLHIAPGSDPSKPNALTPAHVKGDTTTDAGNWKPKGMCMEEAIANLCLGDYFSSCKRWMLKRTPSRGSETSSIAHSQMESSIGDDDGTPATSYEEHMSAPMGVPDYNDGHKDVGIEQQASEPVLQEEEKEEEKVKVLVVEDNMINRKIMVKILSTKLPIEIIEAVDGVEAVEAFKEISGPVIVLLDINMPRKDGFEACQDMRDIEKAEPSRQPAQIIAVTALSAEEEKKHGQQVGFNKWAVKPCGKAAITAIVQDARKTLLGIKDEIETDPDLRRYTM